MTAALEGGEWSAARPSCTLPLGKTQYPFYRRLGGPQGRSGRAENLVPTRIRSRTVQPVVSRYTDWATWPTGFWKYWLILTTRVTRELWHSKQALQFDENDAVSNMWSHGDALSATLLTWRYTGQCRILRDRGQQWIGWPYSLAVHLTQPVEKQPCENLERQRKSQSCASTNTSQTGNREYFQPIPVPNVYIPTSEDISYECFNILNLNLYHTDTLI